MSRCGRWLARPGTGVGGLGVVKIPEVSNGRFFSRIPHGSSYSSDGKYLSLVLYWLIHLTVKDVEIIIPLP